MKSRRINAVGQEAEQLALEFLSKQGLRCVLQNYNCRYGEIDLVMLQQSRLDRLLNKGNETVVAVEVRQRSHTAWGGAAGSVDARKQAKLKKAALCLQAERPEWAQLSWRFDVLAIEGKDKNITWIQSAFE